MRRALLAAEILAAYIRARWLVARRPLPETVAALRRARPLRRASVARDPVAEGRRLGRAVDRALRPMPTDARCLAQALTLTRLLAARRLGGVLVIGVAGGDEFTAHAWVELDGAPLQPSGDGRYQRLTEL